jgi:poly-D-alanine transfer protein DltD
MAETIEEKRKQDFLEKQRQAEALRQEHERKLEQQRILHMQEVQLQEERRKLILYQQKKEEERKAAKLLDRFEEEEENVKVEMERKSKRMSLLKEKKSLRNQMKFENVERVIRMNEFKRLNTLKKIEDADG